DRDPDREQLETRRRFIANYFDRFIRNGGESADHFDLRRLKRDDYGIPQDISKRYFVFAQRDFSDTPAHLSHISPWLIRHFEYAVQLSLDFFNDLKFKKMKDLRKSQQELPIAERRREMFETMKSKRTQMLFLTEGLLLRQMEKDSLLQQYNVIILDEIHERHLNIDLLLGLLRDVIGKRDDMKLILMSATINLELFKEYFNGAPVIQVPGRLYPIQLRYHPIKQYIMESDKKSHKIDPEPYVRILELIDKQFSSSERGDALIFLNGIAEISAVGEALKTYAELTKAWIILMLHSALSVEEQDKVFDVAPTGVRKCILSTNIAETSVTIDGIRFVIDSGKVNLINHEVGSGTQKLSEFWVSKASADQRKGRAGRTGPGVCYRLYSQEQYDKMNDFTPSEINRVALHEMALRMISLNLGLDPQSFPFIERPEEEKLSEALNTLKSQGVLHPGRGNRLTALGNVIAKLPVDVAIAKMLVLGCVFNQVDVILTVAAGLSVQSPFTNRSYRDLQVVERRRRLTSPLGDPFTLIEIFREWVLQKSYTGKGRRWALENGIDEHRIYEISKLRSQYRKILEDVGLVDRADKPDQNDSRLRRIDHGDRKKLFDIKRDARSLEKGRKLLRADKHFDSFLDDTEDDLENEQNLFKADVKTVEFFLNYKRRDIETIRFTHKLTRKDAEVIRVIIAAGLYPQFAILDPTNKYQHGQELFVHTRLKPFSLIHPNSTVAQYHAEALDPRSDSDGRSVHHQIPFFGLSLETTKPYICNVMPVPAPALLLFAKKVISDDWKLVLLDEFVEFSFSGVAQCEQVLQIVAKIRKELNEGLRVKLSGEKYHEDELVGLINQFTFLLSEGNLEIYMKRIVHPPRTLEEVGFFTPDGEMELDTEDHQFSADRIEKHCINSDE
ncbi:hypothetical protein Angca_008420, partial [Angiostrongylus cantonensis]